MTHRDASRTQPTRQTDRPGPAGPRPAPGGAARGGFTNSELDLIHATAEAHGLAIDICTVVVPDGTFPPTPDGALRPEVARIIAGLRKDSQTAPRSAGYGTLADRTAAGPAAARSVGSIAADVDRLAVRADAPAPARAANAVAYDRDQCDLEASRRLADAVDQTDATSAADTVLAGGLEAERG